VSIIRPHTPLTGGLPLARPRQPKRRAPLNPEGAAKEAVVRALVRARSGGVCEVCGNARATNYQHRKNRSQGGLWSASNGLAVCGTGTTGCHGRIHANPAEAVSKGHQVRSYADPLLIPVLTRHGWLRLTDAGSCLEVLK